MSPSFVFEGRPCNSTTWKFCWAGTDREEERGGPWHHPFCCCFSCFDHSLFNSGLVRYLAIGNISNVSWWLQSRYQKFRCQCCCKRTIRVSCSLCEALSLVRTNEATKNIRANVASKERWMLWDQHNQNWRSSFSWGMEFCCDPECSFLFEGCFIGGKSLRWPYVEMHAKGWMYKSPMYFGLVSLWALVLGCWQSAFSYEVRSGDGRVGIGCYYSQLPSVRCMRWG